MFSSRLDWNVRPNPIAELLQAKRTAEAAVLDLTESNPTHAGIRYPVQDITGALADARALVYEPEAFGLLPAREAVAAYYQAKGCSIDPARIMLTASTSEAYAYLFKLLCNPGEEVLAPRPSYPLFDYLARLESVNVIQYPLFYDHGWHVDMAAVRALINIRTRALITVHPNNPTGSFTKQAELAEFDALAQEHGLAIISDEVFSDYAMQSDPARAGVIAQRTQSLSFSLSGLSKIVGLPQMKLGWMVAGGIEKVRAEALNRLELIADTYLSVGTPVQVAAQGLLGWREAIQEQIVTRVKRNLLHLRLVLPRARMVRKLDFEGGWYVILQVPRVRTEEEWTLGLLRDCDVLVQPGYFYDFGAEAYLVVSLLTNPEVFDQGLDRLLRFVAQAA